MKTDFRPRPADRRGTFGRPGRSNSPYHLLHPKLAREEIYFGRSFTLDELLSATEEVTADGPTLRLRFPTGWLEHHPLTRADLEEEAELLASAKIDLRVS